MKLNRTQNTIRNVAWGGTNKIVSILLPFIVKTVIINVLGIDYLGLSNLFASIISMLNITELGFSSAMLFSMYKPLADDDTETICALLNYYRKVYRIMGCIVLLLGLGLLPFLPYLINGSYPADINIYILYLIYLAKDVLGFFLFAYKGTILVLHQRQDIISRIRIVLVSAQYVIQIIILVILKNYYLYLIILPIITIVDNILNAYFATKIYPQYVCRGKLTLDTKRKIKISVGGLSISGASGLICNTMDNIIISAFLGLSSVAIYGNYRYVMTAVHACMIVIIDAMRAGVGNSVASENEEKNYQNMRQIIFIYMWVTGICSVCLFTLYQSFMRLWVGNELLLPISTVILEVLHFFALCIGDIERLYCDTVGYWWKQKKKYILESVLNLGLNIILVQIWGVNGVIFASVISALIVNLSIGIPNMHKYYFKSISCKSEYCAYLYHFCTMLIASGICYWICQYIPEGVFGILRKGIISFFVTNILFVILFSKSKYIKIFPNLIKKYVLVK